MNIRHNKLDGYLKMSVFELHRCNIIGGTIKPDTPACVVFEIAQCLTLEIEWKKCTDVAYVSNIISYMKTVKPKYVEECEYKPPSIDGFHDDDLTKIACFINPDPCITWKRRGLIAAFRHLCTFYQTTPPPLPSKDFVIGPKTMIAPEAYNACMLYRLCSYYGIKTDRLTTIEQMGQAIQNFHLSSDELREHLMSSLKTMNKVQLLNLLLFPSLRVVPSPNIKAPTTNEVPKKIEILKHEMKEIFPSVDTKTITDKSLITAYTRITESKYVLARITPDTHEEAIMMAALIFGINLMECNNPHDEFMHLRNTGNQYTPLDPKFKERYLRNQAWFDVRRTWAPTIPRIYDAKSMQRFAAAEGYGQEVIVNSSAIQLMHMARVTYTFHLGVHPNCTKTCTSIQMDDIKDLHPDMILTYGISDEGPYMLYTPGELSNHFESHMAYTNPEKIQEGLSPESVTKLRNIATEKVTKIKDQTEVKTAYEKLLKVMDTVDIRASVTSPEAKQLAGYYNEGDEKTKSLISEYLTSLLHAAYYMRGWKVGRNKNPPVDRKQTNFEKSEEDKVYSNTNDAIKRLIRSVDVLPESIKSHVRSLPLIRTVSYNGKISFRPSNSEDEGFTILDRIEIVSKGHSGSEYSCIRYSSNWLMVSAYYYMTACGLPAPFDINKLSDIS